MTAAETTPIRRNPFRIGAADIVFVVFALAILQRAGTGMLDDPGLGWQIRIPDAMAEKGGFIWTDPFGESTQGETWTPWGFLGSSLLRFADGFGGLDALAMITALTLAFLLRCLFRMMVNDGVPAVQAVVWTFLAALGISSGWVCRPNLFTLVFMLATVRVCVQFHRERISRGKMLWLIPMFSIWANTHGGFAGGMLAIAIAGLTELGLAIYDPAAHGVALNRFKWFTILGIGCLLGSMVNTYGPILHIHLLKLMGDPFIQNLNADWLSQDFHARGAFRLELLILLLPLLLSMSKGRPDCVSLAQSIVWLHFALNGRRYGPIWVLATVPMLASLAAGMPIVQRLNAWFAEASPIPTTTSPGRSPWLWTVIFAVTLFGSTRYFGGYGRHHPDNVPVPALDKLLEVHQGEKVFHSINWGGYLTWHGWKKNPRLHVWIDDRNEVYGRERIEQWQSIYNGQPGWREALDRAGVGLICIEVDSGLNHRMAEEPGWERLYADQQAVIYRRKGTGERSGVSRPIMSPSGG
jgi:hypothetical protein